ncbi:hypothetical protein EKO27_g8966 [Xylaria grammica]|uniref:Apple domain-containing protein n=1 Tax=Xylaria grammica TaxID=363999 RepID=A0A439CVE3_9PEZI|nr:hypothetical protein EKO27_g8966 [Xylaria grammica]
MDPQQVPSYSYKQVVNESQPGLELAHGPTKKPTEAWAQAPAIAPFTPERTIWGVRRATFFLSIALVVVIIAAAVGGGVGGSLAVQNAKSACLNNTTSELSIVTTTVTAAAAATTSATSTSGPLVVPTGLVKLDCPGLSDDIAISLGTRSWVFTPACDIDYSGSDFAAVIAYSFHDCLQACAAHNHFSDADECTAITFRADQTKYIPSDYGNCWLKKGDPDAYQGVDTAEDPLASAKLKGSTAESESR